MTEDVILIWEFRAGSSSALARIYQKYKTSLLRIASSLLNETCLAEDIVHDVFVALAKSPEQLRINGNLRSYLATCVANRARNVNAARQRQQENIAEKAPLDTAEQHNPDKWIIATEKLLMLNKALSQLSYEQREVVILHLQGNMRFRQIAGSQNASINTVQSRYRYGLEKLRTLLESEVTDEASR
jgi:RNA polymerase sigma-70 factor, ECF subfamily